MSLLTQAMEDVVMLEKKRIPDGEGGFTTDWADGVQFKAAISFDSSMEARSAEKQGVTSLYTITVPMNCKLGNISGLLALCSMMAFTNTAFPI